MFVLSKCRMPFFLEGRITFKDQGSRIEWSFRKRFRLWRKSPFSAYSGQVKSRIAQARRVSGGAQGKFQRKSEKEKAVLPLCTSYKEQEASWAPKRTNYLNHVKCGIKNSIVITLLGKDSHFACKDAVSISRAEIALCAKCKNIRKCSRLIEPKRWTPQKLWGFQKEISKSDWKLKHAESKRVKEEKWKWKWKSGPI